MRIIVSSSRRRGVLGARRARLRSHMGPFETIYINETVAACNGGGGPLGHPRVYLKLGPAGTVECPYCSRLFVNRAMEGAGAATTPPGASEARNA
jgi:uncharacterized Zn-finger protein